MVAMVSVMANLSAKLSSHDSVEIDHRTSVAVCDGIGERLRDLLKPAAPLPHHLQDLMNRLRDIEDAPSIAPGAVISPHR